MRILASLPKIANIISDLASVFLPKSVYRLSIRAYPLARRLLGLDAERRALERALEEIELKALRSRHAAELLRLEKTFQLLALEADAAERREKVRLSLRN